MSRNKKNDSLINASEIGQFSYCSVSWYLQKSGYQPESPSLDEGLTKHRELGEIIDNTRVDTIKSYVFTAVGVFLFFRSILLIVSEVI
jgi:hypothetical protein